MFEVLYLRDEWEMSEQSNQIFEKKKIAYWAKFFAVFVIALAVSYAAFFLRGKSFIIEGDGENQHYKALLYYARWIRTVAKNIFVNHRFEVPTYSLGIGYGGDIITTLSYYVIGDPLTVFAAFVPDALMSRFYGFIIILRIMLSGCAFSAYSFYRKKNASDISVLTASMMYTFCAYVLHSATRHPYFVVPMIWMPLLLMGIDKVINENRHALFIISVAVAGLSNFYFFYMEVIFVIIYAIYNVIGKCKKPVLTLFGLLRDGVIGSFIAAPILLPTILQILKDPRSSMEYELVPFYFLDYYKFFFGQIIGSFTKGYWTIPGTTFLAGSVILLMLVSPGKYKGYKLSLIALVAAYFIPACGYVLSGMSYVSNRWNWIFVLFVCLLVVDVWDAFLEADAATLKREWIATAIYVGIMLIDFHGRMERYRDDFYLGIISMVVVLLATTLASRVGAEVAKKAVSVLVLIMTIVSLAFHGFYVNDESGDALIVRYIPKDEDILGRTENTFPKQIREDYGNDDFYRISGKFEDNTSLLQGIPSTRFYFSLSNPYVYEFLSEMGVPIISTYHYSGLDRRFSLNALAGVRFLTYSSGKGMVYEAESVGEDLYENKNSLPLFYGYDSVLGKDDVKDLDIVDKQEAMLQAAILDTEDAVEYKKAEISSSSVEIPCEVSTEGSVTYDEENGEFIVNGDDAKAIVSFEGVGDSETYLCLDGVYYSMVPEDKKDANYYLGVFESENTSISVKSFKGDTTWIKNTVTVSDRTYKWGNAIHEYAVNGGYSEDALDKFTLEFGAEGVYKIANISVKYQPVQPLKEFAAERNDGIEFSATLNNDNEAFAVNRIEASIYNDSDRLILINLPYDSSWTAFVDGKETELIRANTMFMALNMKQGDHTLVLKYKTGGFGLGWLISVLGIALLVSLEVYRRKTDKRA